MVPRHVASQQDVWKLQLKFEVNPTAFNAIVLSMSDKNTNSTCAEITDCELVNLLQKAEIGERVRQGDYLADTREVAVALLQEHLMYLQFLHDEF